MVNVVKCLTYKRRQVLHNRVTFLLKRFNSVSIYEQIFIKYNPQVGGSPSGVLEGVTRGPHQGVAAGALKDV